MYEGSTYERTDIGFDVCMKDLHVHMKDWFRHLYEGSTHERIDIDNRHLSCVYFFNTVAGLDACINKEIGTRKNRLGFRCLYEGSIHERTDTGFDIYMKNLHIKNRNWFRCLYEGRIHSGTINIGLGVV